MIAYVMREEAFSGHTEFYQYSKQLHFVWSRGQQKFLKFEFNGKEVTDDQRIKIALQDYHFQNFTDFFGVPFEEVAKNHRSRVIATSCQGIYEEMFTNRRNIDAKVEGRITVVD